MEISFLVKTMLFQDVEIREAEEMLHCLQARVKIYQKDDSIYSVGDKVENIGLVITGGANIEKDDIVGNRSILSHIHPGEIFAETYACIPGEAMMVNVTASEKSEILFLNAAKIIETCSCSCAHHHQLVKNLLRISSRKNLELSRRIFHTSLKSIRSRLLSYLSEQAFLNHDTHFCIPFNRQQLADYLGVDRSAMSHELSKMQKENLIACRKNEFTLFCNLSEDI